MNKKQKLIDELRTRRNISVSELGIIGVEIRNRRIKMEMTLSALADNLCSISYMCKIEKNTIVPNHAIFKEVCNRLEMSSECIEMLLNLKKYLYIAVKAYLINDFKKLQSLVEIGAELINYRYQIIMLIYMIAKNDLYNAYLIHSKLVKLTANMSDFDLSIYGLFTAILYFKNQDYEASNQIVTGLYRMNIDFKEFVMLRDKYYLLNAYISDSPATIIRYGIYSKTIIDNGYMDFLDEAKYIYCLYLLNNNMPKELSTIYCSLAKGVYRNTISLLCKLKFGGFIKIKRSWLDNTRAFAKCLALYSYQANDKDKVEVDISNVETEYDFFVEILEYLNINGDKEKLDYISKKMLPGLKKIKNGILNSFFLRELCRLSFKFSRYKEFNEAYRLLEVDSK